MVRALLLDKKNQSSAPASSSTPAPVKAVNQPSAYQALAYQAPIPQTQSVSKTNFESYVKANDVVLWNMQNQGQNLQIQMANLTDMLSKFVSSNTASYSRSGTLPSNTITNPKEDLKGITTRSGVAYQGPTIPTPSKFVKQGTKVTKDQVQTPSLQSTAPVQPPVIQSETQTLVSEPIVAPVSVSMPNLKPSIPYPSRLDNERHHDQANEQIEKFYKIFKDMSFEISFMDALILMLKFASTLKALIGNKEKLRIDECLALADLGASINLMPFSVWEGVSLSKLNPTCMTLELVDRLVSKPIGIAKDVSFKVGVFHFLADFVIVDFEPDPRVIQPSAYQALAYQALIPQTQSVSKTGFESYVKANDAVMRNMPNQGQNLQIQMANLTDMLSKFVSSNTASSPGSGTLPSNIVTNPKEYLKVSVLMPNLKPSIPYPSRRDNERRRDQANKQIEKFYKIFKDMSFEISFMDALILMPKFASTLEALIGNKEKLSEMDRILMNKHCSVVILNKLPRKLREPGKFLIPCEFPGMDECLVLADLGASINLMPLSVWEGLSLPKLTPTCMTLELADRSVSKPIGIAKDVSVKVGVFHFPADFVVVDFKPDPRVPLILKRCFLKTGLALIDVHKGELTLRIGNEAITYNLDQTSKKPDAFLGLEDDPNSPKFNSFYYDPEGDIILLESILNSKPLPPLPNHDQYLPSFKKELKVCEAKTVKSSVDEPPEVELKDLPPYLEYAFLKGDNKFPIIIAKKLGDEEKTALIKNEETELIPTRLVTGWRGTNTIVSSMVSPGIFKFPLTLVIRRKQRSPVLTEHFPIDACLSVCAMHRARFKGEKSHFMIKEGIFLGHKISKNGIEVDKAKVDAIAKLPHPTTVKDCIKAFQTLKKKLTEAPILIAPNWDLPFELMCDASDFSIGAVLGQRHEKHFKPIHYAIKTMNDAESNYTTTEKEMLAVVTHFCNDQFAKVMLKYGVTHHLSIAYHPQTSGQVKVLNRGLKRILERTIGENRASWSDKLDDALWAFRTAYKTPIWCTPYKLMYGKAFHLPTELEHKAYWALKQPNFDLAVAGDHRKVQLNELNELRDHAYENSLIYKEKTKRIHDFKIKNRVFNVGDQVLLFNSRLKIFSGKLKTRWSGPFTIAKVFPYGTVELSQANGPNFKVNGHRVKRYFGGNVPQLVVLDLQTFPSNQ
nr:reverse transcriptase domain-containing protein [Tanacetum cinerariifolium]